MKTIKSLLCSSVCVAMLTPAYATSFDFYDTVKTAVEGLDEVMIAKSNVALSASQVKQSILNTRPTVQASVGAGANFTGKVDRKNTNSSLGISANWKVYDFERRTYATKNTIIDYETAKADLYVAYTEGIKAVISLYFGLIETRKHYTTLERSEKVARALYEQEKIRFQSGASTESLYLRTKASYQQIQASLRAKKLELDYMESEYTRYTGQKAPKTLSMPDLDKVEMPSTLDMAMTQALKNNKSIFKAQSSIDKVRNVIESQRRESLGTINFSISSRKDIKNGGLFHNNATIKYTVPLDFFGVRENISKSNKINYVISKSKLKNKQSTVRKNLQTQWQIYITQKNMVQANMLNIQVAETELKSQQILLESGQGTAKDVLEKVQSTIKAAQNYVKGLRLYGTAIVDILGITGNMDIEKFRNL